MVQPAITLLRYDKLSRGNKGRSLNKEKGRPDVIEPAYGWGSVVKSSARVSSLGFDLFPTPLPTPDAQPSQAGTEE